MQYQGGGSMLSRRRPQRSVSWCSPNGAIRSKGYVLVWMYVRRLDNVLHAASGMELI